MSTRNKFYDALSEIDLPHETWVTLLCNYMNSEQQAEFAEWLEGEGVGFVWAEEERDEGEEEAEEEEEEETPAIKLKIKLTNVEELVDGLPEMEPGMVTCWCDNKELALLDQTIQGTRWEGPADMLGAYAVIMDKPSLVEELEAEGYDVDDSEYSPMEVVNEGE